MQEGKKKVALVDIDGCLLQNGKLNTAMVEQLKDYKIVILFTQRCKTLQRQAISQQIDIFNPKSDELVITPDVVTALEKELNAKVKVSTSLDSVYKKDRYEELAKFEKKMKEGWTETQYAAITPLLNAEVEEEKNFVKTVRVDAGELDPDAEKGIIPSGKIAQYKYLMNDLKLNKENCEVDYFDDSLANIAEINEAVNEEGWANLPKPKGHLVIDKHIIYKPVTDHLISTIKTRKRVDNWNEIPEETDKKFIRSEKENIINNNSNYHNKKVLQQRYHEKNVVEQQQKILDSAPNNVPPKTNFNNNPLKNDQDRNPANKNNSNASLTVKKIFEQTIQKLKDYKNKRDKEQKTSKKSHRSFLGSVFMGQSGSAETKISAAEKSIKILEWASKLPLNMNEKPAPLTHNEMNAINQGDLKKTFGPNALRFIEDYSSDPKNAVVNEHRQKVSNKR